MRPRPISLAILAAAVLAALFVVDGRLDRTAADREERATSAKLLSTCVEAGTQAYDDHVVDDAWRVAGRAAYRTFVARSCRLMQRRGQLGEGERPSPRELRDTAAEVARRMVDQGELAIRP